MSQNEQTCPLCGAPLVHQIRGSLKIDFLLVPQIICANGCYELIMTMEDNNYEKGCSIFRAIGEYLKKIARSGADRPGLGG